MIRPYYQSMQLTVSDPPIYQAMLMESGNTAHIDK